MDRNIYIMTRKLLELSEISLSGAKYIVSTKIFKFFSWEFDLRLPMGYMLIGFKDFFLPYVKASFLFLIILFIIFSYNNFVSVISLDIQLQVLITFLMMICFSLPSRYAYYSTDNESISKIEKILYSLKIRNKTELELIEKNIESIYLRVQDRVKALKWLISACWIAYLFINRQMIAHFDISKVENKDFTLYLFDFIQGNVSILLYFLLPIIFVSIYKRGTNFLFKSILFALNNYKVNIQNKTNKPLRNEFLKFRGQDTN